METNPADALLALAEVAVGLVGFTGIVLALTRRDSAPLPPFVQSPFVPDWVPPTSAGRTCVRATGVTNAWAKGAENRALFADGWVYFASSGH